MGAPPDDTDVIDEEVLGGGVYGLGTYPKDPGAGIGMNPYVPIVPNVPSTPPAFMLFDEEALCSECADEA